MVTAGRDTTATDKSPAYTYFKQVSQNLFPPFSVDNPQRVITVRGKVFYGWQVCVLRQNLACWLPQGAASTAVSQPCTLRMVSLPRHPELGFLSTGSKAEAQDTFMSKHQPSSCPQRPKSETCKLLLISYNPQMFTASSCAVPSQSIQAALGLVSPSTQPMQQLLSVAVHRCRCLTERQSCLAGQARCLK